MAEKDSTELEVEEISFEIEIEEMEQIASPGAMMSD
jgi:hypothetical protein